MCRGEVEGSAMTIVVGFHGLRHSWVQSWPYRISRAAFNKWNDYHTLVHSRGNLLEQPPHSRFQEEAKILLGSKDSQKAIAVTVSEIHRVTVAAFFAVLQRDLCRFRGDSPIFS